jgi:hypothetical protein
MELVSLDPALAVDRYSHPCQNGIKTLSELKHRVFKEPVWIVPTVIPEGATLLAGKPKIGKSFLSLDIALAVACGGTVLGQTTVEQAVLYLSLEDGEKRLQRRVDALVESSDWPDNLYYQTSWPGLDEQGAELLHEWLTDHPEVKLIIIDTLAKVKSRKVSKATQYDLDYRTVESIKNVSDSLGISLLVIHHCRKDPSEDDPFDVISGTTGLSGGFDTCMVLRKAKSSNVFLYSRGRDTEEVELILKHDIAGNWIYLGEAATTGRTDTRNSILELMEIEQWYTLTEMVLLTGRKKSGLCRLLNRMVEQEKTVLKEDGRYCKKG